MFVCMAAVLEGDMHVAGSDNIHNVMHKSRYHEYRTTCMHNAMKQEASHNDLQES